MIFRHSYFWEMFHVKHFAWRIRHTEETHSVFEVGSE